MNKNWMILNWAILAAAVSNFSDFDSWKFRGARKKCAANSARCNAISALEVVPVRMHSREPGTSSRNEERLTPAWLGFPFRAFFSKNFRRAFLLEFWYLEWMHNCKLGFSMLNAVLLKFKKRRDWTLYIIKFITNWPLNAIKKAASC